MNEFDLIRRFFQRPARGSDVLLGIGDDAAVLKIGSDEKLVVTVDTLVEGVHFPENAPAEKLAARCLRTNLSDLAAMGATPRWFTLALTLPDNNSEWLQSFSQDLLQEADAWQVDLVGGDTTKGPLTISIQMMGAVQNKWLSRAGAKPGDAIFVTGTLGDAAGYLLELADVPTQNQQSYLEQRFWYPEPQVEFARRAIDCIGAACDISDGLLADLAHICRASELGAELQVGSLPISAELRKLSPSKATELALGGGDDYELCIAVDPRCIDELEKIAADCDVRLTQIGTFVEGTEVSCFDDDGPVKPNMSGYLHFQ